MFCCRCRLPALLGKLFHSYSLLENSCENLFSYLDGCDIDRLRRVAFESCKPREHRSDINLNFVVGLLDIRVVYIGFELIVVIGRVVLWFVILAIIVGDE